MVVRKVFNEINHSIDGEVAGGVDGRRWNRGQIFADWSFFQGLCGGAAGS